MRANIRDRHPRNLFAAIALVAGWAGLAGPALAASPYGPPLFKAPAVLVDATAGSQPTDETVVRVSCGDIDGDGYPDVGAQYYLTFGTTFSSRFAFMRFHKVPGSPTLIEWPSPQPAYDPGPNPGPVVAELGDLNGDGRGDLVRIDPNGTAVRVQLNSNAGFIYPMVYPMDSDVSLRDLRLVDMDADGLMDIMVLGHSATQLDDFVLMLRNSGSANFQVMTPWALRGLSNVYGFTTGDLDGDTLPDLVIWGNGTSLTMYRNNGSFSYLAPVSITSQSLVVDVVIGKMDGDAMADIAVVHGEYASTLSVHHGTVSGYPTSTHDSHTVGAYLRGLTAADLDKDGRVELVASMNPPVVSPMGPGGSVQVLNLAVAVGQPGYRTSLSPGRHLGRAVASDLDRDGNLDLVVPIADAAGHNVAVVMGPVGQSKGIQLPFNAPSGSLGSPAVGDWNRDGKPDLALSIGTSGRIWTGTGGGSFAAGTNTSAYDGDRLYTADMNRDGRPDLIHSGPANFAIQVGNGDGTFQAMSSLANGGARYVRHPVVDADRDGKADLIWIGTSGDMGVEMGNGTGTLSGSELFVVYSLFFNGPPQDVAAGDLDRDGDADFAVATTSGISLFRSDGVSSVASVANLQVGQDYRSIVAGDIDRDGDLDLVACRRFSGAYDRATQGIDIFYFDGNLNTVGMASLGAAERLGEMVEISDVNRDGMPDIVCTSENDLSSDYVPSTSSVFLQTPAGSFQQRIDFAQGFVPANGFAAFADADGDRQPDIVSPNVYETGAYAVQVNQANAPVGSWGFPGQQDFASNGYPHGLACGDMNRDGKPDLVAGDFSGAVRVFFGNGHGEFATPPYSVSTGSVTDVVLADLDRDSRPDVVAATEGGGVTVLLGQGDGALTAPVVYNTPGPIRQVRTGDFNRDGRPDVVAFGFPLQAYVFLGSPGGALTPMNPINIPGSGYGGSGLTVGDFNRDGKDDVAMAVSTGTPIVYLALGDGTGNFGAPTQMWIQQTSNVISGLASADVNADGKLDLIVALGDGATNPMILLYGDGSGSITGGFAYPSSSSESDYFALAHIDGDPWLDVVQSGLNGTSMRFGDGAGAFGPRYDIGALSSPGGVVIADLDRDGMSDIAINDAGASVTSVFLNDKANITAVREHPASRAPTRPSLAQNTPNPFNPRTSIRFTVPVAGYGSLTVYDVQGRRVAVLANGFLSAGEHRVDWAGCDTSGRPVGSGVYFYRFESGGQAVSRRMVLLK